MADIIDTAGAAGPDAAGVAPQTAPQVPSEAERIERAMAFVGGPPAQSLATGAPPPKAPEAPKPPSEPQPALAEVIRAQREARQQAQQEAQKRSGLEQELRAAREELARARADRDAFEADPVGYAKARKWTPDQQLLYGQSLLYDLAPDKADPDFRVKMFEDRQKRKEAEDAKAREEAQAKAQQEAVQRQVQEFYHDIASAVRTFPAGSYPASEMWFGNDADTYMQSLMATARNVSARATQEGRVADLSPAALASALEAATARRLADVDSRKQARQAPPRAPADAAPAAGGVQSADTMSTRNMTGSGSPRPPAMDERERIRRAAEVAFKAR